MSLTKAPPAIVEESLSPLVAIPEGWARKPIGEVSTIVNGFAFKSEKFVKDHGKPLIRIRDIFSASTAVGYVGEYEARYVVHHDELLVGMDGDFNCARWQGPEALLNQRVCKIAPDPQRLDLDYLTFVLPGYLNAIHDVTSSQTVTHLSSRDVAQIPIPLPPIEVQQHLVQILKAALGGQAATAQHLLVAERAVDLFRRGVLAAACSGRLTIDWREAHPEATSLEHALLEPGEGARRSSSKSELVDLPMPDLPPSFTTTTIGACAEKLDYGTSKLCNAAADSGIPVLRMGNVQDGSIDFGDLKYCEPDAEMSRLLLTRGDLLFNRTNSPELVGKSAVFHGEEPTSFASYLIRVRFVERLADPDYVCYWINSAWGREWARLVKTDGVSQSNINGSKLAAMTLPLPPIEEQREIVKRASHLLAVADELVKHIKAASRISERTVQSVLAKTLRGEPIAGFSS